jgi:hypothetical protein
MIFTLLIIAFIGCDDIVDQSTTPYQIDESLGYLPLNIENNWYYKSEHNSFEQNIVVESKTVVNGINYFILSNLGEHSYPDTIRIINNIVYKFINNKEVVWFDFDANNNFLYKYNSYNVRVETGIQVETILGKFSNCIGFYFDIPEIADEEKGYVFAKGVGIVRMPGAWVDLKLISFKLKD